MFNQSITGANEIVTILFIYTTALGAAISIGRNEHIGIDFFVSLLPKKFYKTIFFKQFAWGMRFNIIQNEGAKTI